MNAPSRPRVLVTGATGFLGRNILAALRGRQDFEVVAACRNPQAMLPGYSGELRVGDLMDDAYQASVVQGIDVICHAGTWGSLWAHRDQERFRFLKPTTKLIEHAIGAGVKRFVMTSTIVVCPPPSAGDLTEDVETRYTGFWPHLDCLMDVENFMRANATRGTQMIAMRLGHFVGAGNKLGLVPALAPRLRTRIVPYIERGRHRLALISDADLGRAFVCACAATGLDDFEAFNICGVDFPTTRAVIEFLASEGGLPKPLYSVPRRTAYLFGHAMEALFPMLPGRAPFLTRSIVYLSEDWPCSLERAERKLGFRASKPWKIAMREAVLDLRSKGYPWPSLA